MPFYELAVGVLATWRLTHLLHAEDGPGDVVARARAALGGGVVGRMLDCFYCTSVWAALPLAAVLGHDLVARLVLWPALSAGAIQLERLTGRAGAAPATFVEAPFVGAPVGAPFDVSTQQENIDGVLRTTAERDGRDRGDPPGPTGS